MTTTNAIDPAAVREMAGRGMADKQIARAMGVRWPAIGRLRRRHNIMAGRPREWQTKSDPDAIRRMAEAGLYDHEIAGRIGCSRITVEKIRHRHGIPAAHPRGSPMCEARRRKISEAKLASFNLAGRYDSDHVRRLIDESPTLIAAAAALGCSVETLREFRRRNGLPSGPPAAVRAAAGKRATDMADVLAAGRKRSHEALLAQYGLPGWLTPTDAKVAVGLVDGPMTAARLAGVIGVAGSHAREGLARLMAAGLVAHTHHGNVRTGGGNYMLTLPALDRMAAAAGGPDDA